MGGSAKKNLSDATMVDVKGLIGVSVLVGFMLCVTLTIAIKAGLAFHYSHDDALDD